MTADTRIAVDIGGTFVDAVELDMTTGAFRFEKAPTTPGAPANGVIDAGLNLRGDQRRGLDRPDDIWVKRQYAAMAAGLDYFEADMDRIAGRLGLVSITAGVMLSYLDFRFPEVAWRDGRPNLTAWHAAFSARPVRERRRELSRSG